MEYKLLICDFSWTLAQPDNGAVFRSPGQPWQWMDGVKDALEYLHRQGVEIAIAQNEGGIAAGHVDWREAREAAHLLLRELSFPVHHLMAPYSWLADPAQEAKNPWRPFRSWRKPSPVMNLLIALLYPNIAQTDVLCIGDRNEDAKAAEAAGFDYQDGADFFYSVWQEMGKAVAAPVAAVEDLPF